MNVEEVRQECQNIYGFENNFIEKGAPEKPLIIFQRDHKQLESEGHQIYVPYGHKGVIVAAHLGVIIGNETSEITKDNALDNVAGYVVALNSTIFDAEYKLTSNHPIIHQTTDFEGCVVISGVVSKNNLPHPNAAHVWTTINGKKVQEGHLTDARYTVQELIEKLSQVVTLKRGDIILCGNPLGATYAKYGDEIEFSIDGVIRTETMIRTDSEVHAFHK